jgi:putative inorganic carbon (hco3(-)) transporter
MSNPAFGWYLLFVVSWFLHLPARIPILGILRLDLLLVVILTALALSKKPEQGVAREPSDKILKILIGYCILTIPLVQWPGSVVKIGLPNFVKAAVFYYFTVAFIRTEQELRRFIVVFIACQTLRVLEPLYLNITEGYWGSQASMSGGWEFMDRLSGSPFDTINPNGLAFIICTILPFLYFMQGLSWKHRLSFFGLTPALLYALILTGSRSGMIALAIVYLGMLVKSKRRLLLLTIGLASVIVGFGSMKPDMQDRYLSTFGLGSKNATTADERVEGMEDNFYVVLHRPIFGHGLGTSAEANYHFSQAGPYSGKDLPAHNLYLEVAQELGVAGLVIFILFMKSIVQGFLENQRAWSRIGKETFLPKLIDAMQVWIVMNIVFSFASYGLSSYDWYLFGGLSIVIRRLAMGVSVTQARQREGSAKELGAPPLSRGRS